MICSLACSCLSSSARKTQLETFLACWLKAIMTFIVTSALPIQAKAQVEKLVPSKTSSNTGFLLPVQASKTLTKNSVSDSESMMPAGMKSAGFKIAGFKIASENPIVEAKMTNLVDTNEVYPTISNSSSSIQIASEIENPFASPDPQTIEKQWQVPQMPFKRPDKSATPIDMQPKIDNKNLNARAQKPFHSVAEEQSESHALEYEFSLNIGYTKLKNWNKNQNWKVDPLTEIYLGKKVFEDEPIMAGLRILNISGSGTSQDTTGSFGFSYIGPYIGFVSINPMRQISLNTGLSLQKIMGVTQLGSGEQEFETPPGLKTDPPGLWAELKYGKITSGAWSNGFMTGVQWGRKKIYYWLGLYTSAWD